MKDRIEMSAAEFGQKVSTELIERLATHANDHRFETAVVAIGLATGLTLAKWAEAEIRSGKNIFKDNLPKDKQ